MKRKGLGKGLGMGYKNLAPMDSHVHSLSAKGVKIGGGVATYLKTKKVSGSEDSHLANVPYDKFAKLDKAGLTGFSDSLALDTVDLSAKFGGVHWLKANDFQKLIDSVEQSTGLKVVKMEHFIDRNNDLDFDLYVKTPEGLVPFNISVQEDGDVYRYDFDHKQYLGNIEKDVKLNKLEKTTVKSIKLNYKTEKPSLDKAYRLEILQSVTVPSTDFDKDISPSKMKKRVQEVERYMSKTFGGETSVQGKGGYVADNGRLIKEDVVVVTAFADDDGFKDKQQKLVEQIHKWKKRWKQESMAYRVEDDLYLL